MSVEVEVPGFTLDANRKLQIQLWGDTHQTLAEIEYALGSEPYVDSLDLVAGEYAMSDALHNQFDTHHAFMDGGRLALAGFMETDIPPILRDGVLSRLFLARGLFLAKSGREPVKDLFKETAVTSLRKHPEFEWHTRHLMKYSRMKLRKPGCATAAHFGIGFVLDQIDQCWDTNRTYILDESHRRQADAASFDTFDGDTRE